MAKRQIDVAALVTALDNDREDRGLSWRSLAAEIGVTPSLLSRLRNGYKPDSDGFMTLVAWLGMSADNFLVADGERRASVPSVTNQLAPLLRAQAGLDEDDIAMITQVVQAAQKRAEARRAHGGNQ